MATINIKAIEQEVEGGLGNHNQTLDAYKTDLQVYHGTYTDPESNYYDADHRARREVRVSGKIIDCLTMYAYQDPPTRQVQGNDEATRTLEDIYNQVNITALLRATDRLRHAADYCALQVHRTDDPKKPIKIYAWTSDSYVPFLDPEDQTTPIAVVTKDTFDNTTRYRLWTQDEVRTYVTKKWNGETSGGRVAQLIDAQPNPYGVIPFVHFTYAEPVTTFNEGGIGAILSRADRHINFRFMENADHLRFSKPRGFITGVAADKTFITKPRAGEWERVSGLPAPDARGGAEKPEVMWVGPPLEWVDKEIDDLKFYWNGLLESVGVPAASLPLDKAIIATVSGVALIAREIPLINYAKKTQERYRHYEQELARLVFTVLGQDQDIELTVNYGECVPDVPPDSPDDYLDNLKEKGELSEVQVCMKRFNLTRERALEHLEQVAKDQAELQTMRTKYGIVGPLDEQQPETFSDITVGDQKV